MGGVNVEMDGGRYSVSSLEEFDQLCGSTQQMPDTIPYEILSKDFMQATSQPLPQQQQQGVRLSQKQRDAATGFNHSGDALTTLQMGGVPRDVDTPASEADADVPALLQRQMG